MDLYQNLKNKVLYNYHSIAENVIPTLKTSKFKETGMLTPEEFVMAGDKLVTKCPSWLWCSSDNMKGYLPDDKQFLITRNVPTVAVPDDIKLDNDWVVSSSYVETDVHNLDDSTYNDDDNILKTNRYDITIVYDNYYRVPRMYIFGYDCNGGVLSYDDICKNIADDQINKVATYENHPHLDGYWISIHPCNHGAILKNMSLSFDLSVDDVMFVFLKFMQGILSGINYDFTF